MESAVQGQDPHPLISGQSDMITTISESDIRDIQILLHRERLVFTQTNIHYNSNNLEHRNNFINLTIGFHNINELVVTPQKLIYLVEWCNYNHFDFMGIAETNINITNLQFRFNNHSFPNYTQTDYNLIGSHKYSDKLKGSGVGLLIHKKWMTFHYIMEIISPFLMVSKFNITYHELWIWVYYLPSQDKETQQHFK
ncbi:hypothetical protein RclHR1_04170003 [Rhizophagus clarus]|uniref:Uncharacterized protein n=1 Tax=Rhizophagus clarus TaxID=94130 RepID=A0A2Z6RFE4_9GLOM|nr:hypothetical protein RclHR1_04170003 [Rhizophagus clarus]